MSAVSVVARGSIRALEIIGMVAIVAMMLNVVADVVLRSLLNAPVRGTLELMTFWYMVAASVTGMVIAQTRFEHISVAMITERVTPRVRRAFKDLGYILSIVALLGMTWFGFEVGIESASTGEYVGADRIPIWPVRLFVPICLLVFAATMVVQLITRSVPLYDHLTDGVSDELEENHLDDYVR